METSLRIRSALAEAVLAFVEGAVGNAPGAREALLAHVQAPALEPADSRRSLDIGAIAALLEEAAALLDDPTVGLHLAAGFEIGALGPFSYAVLHAPTLGTALRNVERYSGSVAVGASLRLEVGRETASLVLPAWVEDPGACRQLGEAAVLFLLRMLRQLGGQDWAPLDLGFRHAAPADTGEHERLLGAPIRFERLADSIRFRAADLERPVRDADRFLLPIVERQLRDVVADHAAADPWRQAVELQVARHVCDGHPSIATIAPRLGLSVRTLQRRLDERGLSYRQLVADVRLRLARQYLTAAEPSLGEVAFLLGYSELSAFDRAFRAWTGERPGDLRRRCARGGESRPGRPPHAWGRGEA